MGLAAAPPPPSYPFAKGKFFVLTVNVKKFYAKLLTLFEMYSAPLFRFLNTPLPTGQLLSRTHTECSDSRVNELQKR